MDLIQCTVVFILSSSHKGREREKRKKGWVVRMHSGNWRAYDHFSLGHLHFGLEK